jgi:hypothetical protein
MAFSLVIVAMLIISRLLRLVEGVRRRPEPGWGCTAAAGGAALLAAQVIHLGFPGGALWLLGLVAWVVFLIEGMSLLSLGFAARHPPPARLRGAGGRPFLHPAAAVDLRRPARPRREAECPSSTSSSPASSSLRTSSTRASTP